MRLTLMESRYDGIVDVRDAIRPKRSTGKNKTDFTLFFDWSCDMYVTSLTTQEAHHMCLLTSIFLHLSVTYRYLFRTAFDNKTRRADLSCARNRTNSGVRWKGNIPGFSVLYGCLGNYGWSG